MPRFKRRPYKKKTSRRRFFKRMRRTRKVYDQCNRVIDYVGGNNADTATSAIVIVNWANNYVDPGVPAADVIALTDSAEFNDEIARWQQYKVTYCKATYMISDIARAAGTGVNDTVICSPPHNLGLAGVTVNQLAKVPDFTIQHIGANNASNKFTKRVNVQKYMAKKSPSLKGWLEVGQYPLELPRFLFNSVLQNFNVGDRVGTLHVQWWVSFRNPV